MIVTSNILTRVFRLNCGNSEGTCFTLEVDGRQYVITANHLVESADTIDDIRISHRHWGPTSVQLVGHADGDIDISVLACDRQISHIPEIKPSADGLMLCQDVYFLGFPYGLATDVPAMHPYSPLPLVKKAIFSGGDIGGRFYLDGHNNPGFSGGPIICEITPKVPSIIGVVRGFLQGRGDDSGNSGIVTAYGIQHALDLIEQNPIGFELPSKSAENS